MAVGLSNKDWNNEVALTPSIVPGAKTATTNGTAADTAGYRRCAVVIEAGVWTDGTHTFKIQSSATSGGTYADDPAVLNAFTVISGAGQASATYWVEVDVDNLLNRWIRVVATVAGATTGAVYGATIVGFNQRIAG